ncbi:sugar ABC transporter substrate-binding protein [Marinomonas posidonica]|uniref:Periplasmic binding protein/LacI transcriptional regulator n=1 Tax=Marinomonas posidonica (strain CECT 7376 / NCIMB 14433 / IVIA-Po-181) TaxID=491952 RepID=F6CU19_MARPP|nr:sugar ABC transporter substrate-binding protein [Marinomonas posidonica]AEF54071.1 periplasmic binding protein/LacI transcriptional regulator [Marinomonas posidonica IVIA-Po-181]
MKIKKLIVMCAFTTSVISVGASAAEIEKIGLAVPNLSANYFIQIKESVEEYATKKGIKVITVNANDDSSTQVSQVQDLMTQNIDAFLYIPAGAAAATVPPRLARRAGIPVVNLDRNAETEPGDTFIAGEGIKSAYKVCNHIIDLAGGKGEMIIIHGQKGVTPEVNRTKGCEQAIAENPGVKLVANQWSERWSQDEGFSIAQNLLQAYPKVNLIFGQADGLAMGASKAVAASGLNHRIFVGGYDGDTGALLAIKKGVFDVTATQSTRSMGRLAVDSAIKLAAGGQVPKEQIIDAVLTTSANVDAFIADHP